MKLSPMSRTLSQAAKFVPHKADTSALLQMHEAAASVIPEGLAWEESAGISAPLLDIVDVLFNLQSHGFFRRQVGHVSSISSFVLHICRVSIACLHFLLSFF